MNGATRKLVLAYRVWRRDAAALFEPVGAVLGYGVLKVLRRSGQVG